MFTTVTGHMAPFPGANIDTDVIMPKQFLKGIDRSGLDQGVFYDQRFAENGEPRLEFILNRPGWMDARFLVVGPNFGCGSSREHAVWGLSQLGIRALIGTTFAGIFFDNCARNGLLAITMAPDEVSILMESAADSGRNNAIIDLPKQTVQLIDGNSFRFDIEPDRKEALVLGLDVIGATLKSRNAIEAFERSYLIQSPWLV